MCRILSIIAIIAGLWLVYMGYERQQSIAGKAETSLSKLGQKIDGGDHTANYMFYYAAGAVLVAGGAFGFGRVRK